MTTKNAANTWGKKLAVSEGSSGRYRKASALEDGQSMTGTILGFNTKFVEKLGKNITSILMENNGDKFELTPAGTINDALSNNQLKVGTTYTFVKEGLKKTAKGGYKGIFGIYEGAA